MINNFTLQQKNFIYSLKAHHLYVPFRIIIMGTINSWVDLEIIPKTRINEKIIDIINQLIKFKKRFGMKKTIQCIKLQKEYYSMKYYLQI